MKKNQMTRCLAVLLAALMILALAACAPGAGTTAAGTTAAAAGTTAAATTTVKKIDNFNATGYPIVTKAITIKVAGPLGSSPTFKGMNLFTNLTKITGIEFTFDEYTNDAWTQQKSLIFASGNLPDLFIGAGFDMTLQTQYGSSGQLLALGGLIDQYAPNIQDAFKKVPIAKAMSTASDGKIYTLPLINQVPRDLHQRYWISTTWLKKVGLDVPKTLDDLYKVLVAFKGNDANGNGKSDEIPLSGQGGITIDGLILNALGLVTQVGTDGGYQLAADNSGKVFCVNTSDGYKDYLTYLHKLYAEKLLDNDFFVQTNDQMTAKGTAGTLGCFASGASYITCGATIGYDYTQFDALTSARSSKQIVSSSAGIIIGRSAISGTSKYPEAIIRLLDYCFTEEGSKLNRNGEEGYSWEYTDKAAGKWVWKVPSGYDNDQTWRAFVTAVQALPSWYRVDFQNGQGTKNALWLNEMTDRIDAPYFVAAFPSLSLSKEDNDAVSTVITDATNYVKQARARFITGEDDINAKWSAYTQELKSIGVDKVVTIYQKYYDKYTASMK